MEIGKELESIDINELTDTGKWREMYARIREAIRVQAEQRAAQAKQQEALDELLRLEREREEREKHERSAIKSAFNRVWRAVVAAVKDDLNLKN